MRTAGPRHPACYRQVQAMLYQGRRRGGFTLTEILVVLAIVGSLLAITIPFFGMMIRRARLDAAARQMNILMLAARSQAIKRGNNVGVVVSTKSNYLWKPSGYASAITIYPGAAVFVDSNSNGTPDDGEAIIGDPYSLPEGFANLKVSIDTREAASPGSTAQTTSFVFTAFGNARTGSDTNGVFFSDTKGNVLQVSIPVVTNGKVVMTKRTGSSGGSYAQQPWTWF